MTFEVVKRIGIYIYVSLFFYVKLSYTHLKQKHTKNIKHG